MKRSYYKAVNKTETTTESMKTDTYIIATTILHNIDTQSHAMLAFLYLFFIFNQ